MKKPTFDRSHAKIMIACQVCENGINVDFVTRCGHKFHTNCIILKKNPKNAPNFCPVCQNKIFNSIMLEGVLNKARQQDDEQDSENSNFDTILNFFEEINDFDRLKISSNNMMRHPLRNRNVEIDKYVIETAINFGLDLNSNDPIYKGLLKFICVTDNLHKLNLLIDMGLILNENEELGIWFVREALNNESLRILERMKEFGFDPKTFGKYFEFNFTFILTKWLIENGFDIYQKINSDYIIHIACNQKMLHTAQLLQLKGIDIECKNKSGLSPFHLAVKTASSTANEYLDKDSQRLLNGLIELGSDIESIDDDNSTPLYSAITKPNRYVISFLLSHGANLNNQKIKNLGQTIFIFAEIFSSCECKPNIFSAAFEKLSDINERDPQGQTLLHKLLSKHYSEENIKYLINILGADVNAQDLNGNTPLHILCSNMWSDYSTVILLKNKGADTRIKNNEGEESLSERYKSCVYVSL